MQVEKEGGTQQELEGVMVVMEVCTQQEEEHKTDKNKIKTECWVIDNIDHQTTDHQALVAVHRRVDQCGLQRTATHYKTLQHRADQCRVAPQLRHTPLEHSRASPRRPYIHANMLTPTNRHQRRPRVLSLLADAHLQQIQHLWTQVSRYLLPQTLM